MIADPLRLLMCSPVADGAAAVVVCSEERARSFGAVPPVRIDASVLRSGGSGDIEIDGAVAREHGGVRGGGVGPADLDVVEVPTPRPRPSC